jgi:hypothetical protein
VTVPSSRAQRRLARTDSVQAIFGADTEAALDLLELVELAWHDCYDEVTPPDAVVADILICSQGRMADLARACRLAVQDYRDLRLWADGLRAQ